MKLDDIYSPLLVGSWNKESDGINRDDIGENISNKNENYCELTGLYWIWKNSKEDIVGLCHYRRFLSKRNISINSKYFLNQQDIKKYLESGKYDIILPKKEYVRKNIETRINIAPNRKDMSILRDCIKNIYPNYLKDYDAFMKGNGQYVANVMITKKEILNEYSKWLFDILFLVEDKMDKSDYIYDSYRKRMFGFLSERLLNVWILHNQNKYKIKEFRLVNTQLSFTKRAINECKRVILRFIGGIL